MICVFTLMLHSVIKTIVTSKIKFYKMFYKKVLLSFYVVTSLTKIASSRNKGANQTVFRINTEFPLFE